MKVLLENYNSDWPLVYNKIEKEIKQSVHFIKPKTEHIGSTAIQGLAAKPIIDILVGVSNPEHLDLVVEPLMANNYIYYEKYNSIMPYRRFFVKLKSKPNHLTIPAAYYENDLVPNELNEYKMAHVHVLEYNSYHWVRHIAFREYLKNNETVKKLYQELKVNLSTKTWLDGNEYNTAKNDFIKEIERKAIEWYER